MLKELCENLISICDVELGKCYKCEMRCPYEYF